MDRRSALTILLLMLVAASTWLLSWSLRPHEDPNQFTGPPRSGYTLDRFTLDAMDTEGGHAFTVIAPHLTRRDDDGSIYVATPDYEIVDNSSNVWKGTSESAWVNKDGTIMKLEGKVLMHRVPTDKVNQVDLATHDLTITTDPKAKDAQGKFIAGAHRDKRMETAAPTTISDANNISRSIGMKADMDLKTIELLSDVHTISYPGKQNGG